MALGSRVMGHRYTTFRSGYCLSSQVRFMMRDGGLQDISESTQRVHKDKSKTERRKKRRRKKGEKKER